MALINPTNLTGPGGRGSLSGVASPSGPKGGPYEKQLTSFPKDETTGSALASSAAWDPMPPGRQRPHYRSDNLQIICDFICNRDNGGIL
jgi:hypothetical protein